MSRKKCFRLFELKESPIYKKNISAFADKGERTREWGTTIRCAPNSYPDSFFITLERLGKFSQNISTVNKTF